MSTQMRGRAREGDELSLPEDRHDDPDVGRVRRALVRVVVRDDVALVDPVEPELADHALDDLRHRAHEHGRRVRLGDLVALGVEEPGAEVLGLADDRRVGDPEEDRAHLLRDRLERSADDAHEHGVRQPRSGVVGLCDPGAVDDDVPVTVDLGRQARRHDRRRVVLLDHGRPGDRLAGAQRLPVVEGRGHRAGAAIELEHDVPLERGLGLARLELGGRPLERRHEADAARRAR